MKETATMLTSLLLAGAASAYEFPNNPVFYGNEDLFDDSDDSKAAPVAIQPGIGDTYGGHVFAQTGLAGLTEQVASRIAQGSNDAYGSAIPNVEEGTLDW